MTRHPIRYFPIEVAAVVLAILIHIIAVRVFVFLPSMDRIARRPIFVFWGSFLDPIESDLVHKRGYPTVAIAYDTVIQSQSLPKGPSVTKPGLSCQQHSDARKSFVKTDFLDESPLSGNNSEKSKQSRIEIYEGTKAEFLPIRSSKFLP